MLLTEYLAWHNLTLAVQLGVIYLILRAIGYAIYNRYFHPYKDFPGPFWASITSLWYFRAVRHARGQDHQLPIHKKYGPFVRISPDQIQIMDPAAIETIYGPKNVFIKAEFYEGFNPKISPRRGNFEEADERLHSIRRRIVAPLYTQGAVLEFEPCVDRLISLFYHKMDHFAKTNEPFDMSVYLRKYTFDVVGEIFYGREGGFGFLRDDIDYNRWCHLMDTMPPTASALTYIPWGFRNLYFLSEMIYPSTRAGAKGFFDVIKQSHVAVKERLNDMASGKHKARNDMLSRLLDLVDDTPTSDPRTRWTIKDVTAELWTVIWAGSDTTSIALTSIFYHLHRHPHTLSKLLDEIDAAFQNGTLTYPLRYTACITKLPYLHAVVREAMRIHPSLGTGLPRIVPPGGATICGRHFPEGLGVIMSQCAVHFDKGVFGEDAEEFVPERWLRDGAEKASVMERHILQFGYGPRICIGKHITMVEMYKLLPTILREFEFEGVGDGEEGEEGKGLKEWKVWAGWFHQQKGVDVRVRRRRRRLKSDGEEEEQVVVPLGEWAVPRGG